MNVLYVIIAFLAGTTFTLLVVLFLSKRQSNQLPVLQQNSLVPPLIDAPVKVATPQPALIPIAESFVLRHDAGSNTGISVPDIQFTRIVPSSVGGKADRTISAFSSVLPATATNAMVAQGIQGTFRATVDPSTLLKYDGGGFSSMVKGAGGIQQHAGFAPTEAAKVFTPLVAFQIMSMATGQYYLNGINKQLTSIAEKIQTLINYHHTEKLAILKTHCETLKRLLQSQAIHQDDAIHLKSIIDDIRFIRSEYSDHLNNYDTSSFASADNDNYLTSSKIEALSNKWVESQCTVHSGIVLFAQQLDPLATMTELKVNSVLSRTDPLRVPKCKELLDTFLQPGFASINADTEKRIKSICDSALSVGQKIQSDAWINEDSVRDFNSAISEEREMLNNIAKRDEAEISGMVSQLREYMSEKVEILLVSDQDGMRLLQA